MKRIVRCFILVFIAVCFALPFTASAEGEKQKITYYCSFAYPPYRQLTEYGEHVGFEVDVGDLIFLDSPYEIEFVDDVWKGSAQELFEKTDADCFGLRAVTEHREEVSLISEPFYMVEFRAFGLAKNRKEIRTFEDLKSLRVTARINTQSYHLLMQNDVPFITAYQSEDIARALVDGEVDIAFAERRSLEYFLSNFTNMSNIVIYETPAYDYPAGLMFDPKRADLKEYADERIAEIKRSGELESLYYRYFGVHTSEYLEREEKRKQYLNFILVACLIALTGTAFMGRHLVVKRRLERKMRMSDERYDFLLNESGTILVDFIAGHEIIAYSKSISSLLDMPENFKNFHHDFRHCIHPEDLPDYVESVEKIYAGEADSVIKEIRMRTTAKEYEYFLAKAKALPDDGGRPRFCGIYFNINEQKLLQSQMEKTLNYDKLTGAMNRGKFISECDSRVTSRQDERFALICMDVDNFTKVNNLCGYDTGDYVLKQLVLACSSCAGEQGGVLGRLGNDDFALMVPARDEGGVRELFSRIADIIAKISVGSEIKIPVRIHGGFAFFEEGDTILSLLTKANAAQCVAGIKGELIVNYTQGVKDITLERDELSRDIVESFNNGDFEMWYQPKVDLKTQRLVGMEALMRWEHPKKGKIPPSVFIELAEQIGFIDTLDTWAIAQACRQNKIWQDNGFPHVRISANLSKALFQNLDLLKLIASILEETGLDGHYLDIELTESLAVLDTDKTINVLNSLRDIGVTVSMDDFGSGYASLGTLKMLPFDTLKIDRSLIVDVDKNQTSQQIIKAIMDIADSISLGVVAEGVETLSQLQYLEKLDCDTIQGYYFGRPLPAGEFEKNFRKVFEKNEEAAE